MSKHTHAAEQALMDMLKSGHAAATNGLADEFYKYIENILTEMIINRTLNYRFMRILEWWSQTLEIMDAITLRVLHSKTFTNMLANIFEQQMAYTVIE